GDGDALFADGDQAVSGEGGEPDLDVGLELEGRGDGGDLAALELLGAGGDGGEERGAIGRQAAALELGEPAGGGQRRRAIEGGELEAAATELVAADQPGGADGGDDVDQRPRRAAGDRGQSFEDLAR